MKWNYVKELFENRAFISIMKHLQILQWLMIPLNFIMEKVESVLPSNILKFLASSAKNSWYVMCVCVIL